MRTKILDLTLGNTESVTLQPPEGAIYKIKGIYADVAAGNVVLSASSGNTNAAVIETLSADGDLLENHNPLICSNTSYAKISSTGAGNKVTATVIVLDDLSSSSSAFEKDA